MKKIHAKGLLWESLPKCTPLPPPNRWSEEILKGITGKDVVKKEVKNLTKRKKGRKKLITEKAEHDIFSFSSFWLRHETRRKSY